MILHFFLLFLAIYRRYRPANATPACIIVPSRDFVQGSLECTNWPRRWGDVSVSRAKKGASAELDTMPSSEKLLLGVSPASLLVKCARRSQTYGHRCLRVIDEADRIDEHRQDPQSQTTPSSKPGTSSFFVGDNGAHSIPLESSTALSTHTTVLVRMLIVLALTSSVRHSIFVKQLGIWASPTMYCVNLPRVSDPDGHLHLDVYGPSGHRELLRLQALSWSLPDSIAGVSMIRAASPSRACDHSGSELLPLVYCRMGDSYILVWVTSAPRSEMLKMYSSRLEVELCCQKLPLRSDGRVRPVVCGLHNFSLRRSGTN